MGETCCSGRSKAVRFEHTREFTETLYVAKRSRLESSTYDSAADLSSIKYYEQGSNDLQYNLRSPEDFSKEEESAFSAIFLRYRTAEQRHESAVTAGDCYELSILGQREARRVVISTAAVYLCHLSHLANVSWRALLSQLYLISMSENSSSAVLHADSPATDVWLTGELLQDILRALQKAFFVEKKHYISSETVSAKGGLRYRVNNVDSALHAAAKSEAAIRTAAIVVRFGQVGESRVFSKECMTEKESRRRKCEFLLTNRAIYSLFPTKVERVALSEVTSVRFLSGKVVVTTKDSERSWKLPSEAVEEIQRIREGRVCIATETNESTKSWLTVFSWEMDLVERESFSARYCGGRC